VSTPRGLPPGRRAASVRTRGLSRPRRALYLLALALGLGLGGCQDEPPRTPHVLFITLDSVRADRLGSYGYQQRDCTPVLDALATESVLFEQSFAASSFTPPSHASLFTGLYPSEHGLTYWNRKLADVPTAAELFAAAGYRTLAISPLKTLFLVGLERGFEQTFELPFVQEQGRMLLGDAEAINATILPELTAPGERPFFAWLHYYDAHRVYGRQGEQWARRYTDARVPLAVGDSEDYYQLGPEPRPGKAMSQADLNPAQARFISDRYDGGLAYLDQQLGKLFDALEAAGVLDDTLIVITADHGEVLSEHAEQWFSHDPHLVDENIRVPLLLRLPPSAGGAEHAGRRVASLASGVDLLPTLLSLAGVDAGSSRPSGIDLAPLVRGAGGARREVVFAERQAKDRRGEDGVSDDEALRLRDMSRMLRTVTHKLVHHVDRGTFALYDVNDERTDLFGSRPEQAAALVARYQAELARLSTLQSADSGLDDEALAQLAELGYLSKAPDGQ